MLSGTDSPRSVEHTQLTSLMEAAGDVVFRLSSQGEILYASKRTIEVMDPDRALAGTRLTSLVPPADRLAIELALKQAIESQQPSRVNVRMNTHNAILWFELQATAYVNASGAVELLAVGRDISGQHATEERLRHMATHDVLTGLPNRSLLSDRLGMAVAQARRTGKGFSVVALDLDGFKKVNDALGHPVGDTLLRIAGERLQDILRDVDTLARVGGDEFVAILPGAVEESEIQIVARRMIATMQLPFEIQGHALYVSTSIGAATYPQ
ncbi:MAG TPA: histidine kinase, partial [Oxalobacteraceae bacterium]|nr:histidine kinase [Oxalobacteraceae bacterium]